MNMPVALGALTYLLWSAAQTAPIPPSTSTPHAAPASNDVIHTYFGCIRTQSELWLKNATPRDHVNSVITACAPSLEPAAREIAATVVSDPRKAKILAAYKAKHGKDLDLTSAIAVKIEQAAKAGSLQILNGYPGQIASDFKIDFDSDGIKP